MMAGVTERSAAALRAFRIIVSEMKKSNKSWSRSSQQYTYLLNQMREHQLTQRLHCKGANEVEHLANTYATYLTSTRRLTELQEKFRGGERSIEQSAALVGLKLPNAQ